MRFADPWALIALPFFFLAVAFFMRRKGKPGRPTYSSIELFSPLRSKTFPWIVGALVLLPGTLLILGLARPQLPGDRFFVPVKCRDVLFLIDQSQSLRDNDFADGKVRLPGQKKAISQLQAEIFIARELIKTRPKDRVGVMFFANIPTLLWPLSYDRQPLDQRLAHYQQSGFFTVMGPALLAAVDHLEDLSRCDGQTLVFISDGYVSMDGLYTRVHQDELRQRVRDLGIQFYWIQVRIEIGQEKRWAQLRELAAIHNGAALPIYDKQSLHRAAIELQRLVERPAFIPSRKPYVDLYPWFLIGGIAGIMILIGFLELLVIREVEKK